MNLFETIDHEMQSDILEGNENSYRKSDRLLDTYEQADEKTKAVIDDLFITLTGWSFKMLIDKQGERSEQGYEDTVPG